MEALGPRACLAEPGSGTSPAVAGGTSGPLCLPWQPSWVPVPCPRFGPWLHHLPPQGSPSGLWGPSTSPVQLPIEFPKLTPHPRPCSPALLWWEKAHLPPAERRPQLPRPELAPTPHPGRPQPLDSAVPHTLPTASPASHSQAAAACCPRPSGKAGMGPAPSPPALPPGSAVLSSVQEPQLPRTIQKALGVKTASPVTPKRCPFHSCSACTAERPMT